MTQEEAEQLLGSEGIQFSEEARQQAEAGPYVSTPAPLLGRLTPSKAEEQFMAENKAQGIPLDISTGVSPWQSLMLEFRRNQENQIKYLESKYGKDTVRLSTDGELIVRTPDPDKAGAFKDLLVRPHQMKATDFIDLLATVPEVALSIYAMRKGEQIPWLGKKGGLLGLGREAVAGATGGEAAGALKDIAANVYDIGTPQIGDVLEERGKRLLPMTAIAAAGGAIPRTYRALKNPLAGYRKETQQAGLAAMEEMRAKPQYGETANIPLTVGQSTGAPLFGRSEVYVEKQPGGSGPIRKIYAEQDQKLRDLQERMLGGTGLPTEEELGTRAIQELQPQIRGVTGAATQAEQNLAKTASDAIDAKIDALTQPGKELYHSQTGRVIRDAVTAKRNAVKAESDRLYGIVNAMPEAQGKVFEGTGLQSEFARILKDLPSPKSTVQSPTGLLDRFGNPITTTTAKEETLKEFVPPNVLARLQKVASLKDPKFSLSDLQQMRREVYDDISRGEGVPGLGTHYLADIGKALTKAIDDGVSALPKSDLKTALGAANDYYKTKLVPFNRLGLTELFRKADESGFVSDSEVIGRLFGGANAANNWKLMKETLGDTSSEFIRLKRSIADTILQPSRIPGEALIDAKSLQRNLINFSNAKTGYPEIYDDIFKPEEKNLFEQLKYLHYAQGDKLDERALRTLMASPNPTASKFRQLILAQKQQDLLYRNQILKAVGDGTLNEQTLSPSEFLNRMVSNKSIGPNQVKQVIDAIQNNPTLAEDIRRKTLEKIFRDNAREATAKDLTQILSGKPSHLLSGVKLANQLADQDFQAKAKIILGPDLFKDLQNFGKIHAMLEVPEQSFKSAGGIAAGTQVAQAQRILEAGGVFRYIGNVGRTFIFSYLLSNPAARRWLSSVPSEPTAVTDFLSKLIASPQFVETVSREFPKAPGMQFIHNLKIGLDRSTMAKEEADAWSRTSPDVRRQKWDAFLGTNAPAFNR